MINRGFVPTGLWHQGPGGCGLHQRDCCREGDDTSARGQGATSCSRPASGRFQSWQG